jgi:hypothetical protein
MRTLLTGVFVFILLAGGIAGGWVAMNYYNPGNVGTPAHAGALSNGQLQDCTNVNFSVKPRSTTRRTITLQAGNLLRGTYEADGGFGRVDIMMRVESPQGDVLLTGPRAANYDFSIPAKINGDYVVIFDNRYSLYTAKSIGLFTCIDTGRSPVPITPFFPRPTAPDAAR